MLIMKYFLVIFCGVLTKRPKRKKKKKKEIQPSKNFNFCKETVNIQDSCHGK